MFLRLTWHPSGHPVVRLPGFLQVVPEHRVERGLSHAANAATSLTVLKFPASQGGPGMREGKAARRALDCTDVATDVAERGSLLVLLDHVRRIS